MTTPSTARAHAVVIGASMGGLAAAAALASHYRRVTVLDRDVLPSEPAHRRAVPQSKHAHGLQPGGLRALDDLLPGLVDELLLDGVPLADASAQCRWTVGGTTFARARAGALGIGVTRPYLEHQVRSRVAALPNVLIRDRVEVRGLIADDPDVVTGVAVVDTRREREERIDADLVVDACGKVSALPQWLVALGYPAPAEESVTCAMAYLSRRWQLAEAPTDVITVCTTAERPHFGVMIAQEDGTHIVTLGGLLGQSPATDDDAYLDFARSLCDSAIADALTGATPVTSLQPSHFPASRRRRYDRMRTFPRGVLALGDAIAAFNPMYGQGMSVAALEAVALRDMLRRGPLDAHRFFAKAHRIEDVAWKISTGGDLRYEGVEGRRTPDMRLMNRYLDRVTAAAAHDTVVAHRFLAVAGFLAPPQSLFAPSIVWRVLRASRRAVAVSPAPIRVPAPVGR